MQTVVLNRTSRILRGHLWVFSNEIMGSPRAFAPGSLVELADKKGASLGIGYVNPRSLIAVRILTRENEPIDRGFFKRRIENALSYRTEILKRKDYFRAVYSESDLLPGLIVDKFGDCLSVQFLTLGMETLKEVIIDVLDELFKPSAIVLRNDSSIRTLEGLALEKTVARGSVDGPFRVTDGGVTMEVDPLQGQKTGFFLDQTENRAAFADLCSSIAGRTERGGEGLDLFSYTGAWSLRMARAGVARVTGIDASEYAVKAAKKNAELNGLADRCLFEKADVIQHIKQLQRDSKKYDYIVSDPPSFVKSKANLNEGTRAYRDLNASCMRLLAPGGLLAASSCSYHVDRPAFLETLRAASTDAKRTMRIVEVRGQAKDHPISLNVPETEYLKCVILQAID